MPEDPKLPAGLKVARTPSGGFRFELPRPRGAVLGAAVGVPFLLFFMGFALFLAWSWWHQARGGGVGLFGLLFAIPFVAFPLAGIYGILCAAFGHQALEVDDRAITRCSRLPPLPESRKVIRLEEITALAVDESQGSKGGVSHYLAIKAGKKEHRVAEGLSREALEWLGARVAALADRARDPSAAGRSLTATLEADLLRDRLETGEVTPEDLDQVEADEPPPGDAGIEVIERGRGLLRLKLAGRGGRSLLVGGASWVLIVGGGVVVAVLSYLRVISGDQVPLAGCIGITLFWSVGIVMMLIGLRQRTLVEELEIRPEGVDWRARSILGTNSRSISGRGIRLSQNVSYTENYQPVYHLRLTAPDGRMVKFAGNLKPEAQAWLLAHIGKALGPEAVENDQT